MTEQEIKDKAKDVYIRCFDDDINYPCILEALEIAIRESTEEKIADLKANFDYVLEGKDLEIKELGERCNQLLKDKGDLTDRCRELEKEYAELKEQLEICETNADTYYDELTKLQEQLVKTTQIGLNCSNCKWSQYDEDEMCYCCSNKDKWELKLRR